MGSHFHFALARTFVPWDRPFFYQPIFIFAQCCCCGILYFPSKIYLIPSCWLLPCLFVVRVGLCGRVPRPRGLQRGEQHQGGWAPPLQTFKPSDLQTLKLQRVDRHIQNLKPSNSRPSHSNLPTPDHTFKPSHLQIFNCSNSRPSNSNSQPFKPLGSQVSKAFSKRLRELCDDYRAYLTDEADVATLRSLLQVSKQSV